MLPYIIIQFIMIMVVISFPGLVTHYKDEVKPVNLNDVHIRLPGMGGPSTPGGQGGYGLPGEFNMDGTPPAGGDQPAMGLPGLPGGLNLNGTPPADGGQPALGLPGLPNLGGTPPAAEPAPAGQQPSNLLNEPPKIQ